MLPITILIIILCLLHRRSTDLWLDFVKVRFGWFSLSGGKTDKCNLRERTQDTSGHYNSKPKQETAYEKSLTPKGRHHYLLIVIVIITSIAKTSLFGLWTVKRLPQDNSQPLPSLIYSSEIRHTCVPLYVQRSLRFKSLGCCMWSELHNSQTLISLIAGPMLIATHSLR